jgi:hypothetical protein
MTAAGPVTVTVIVAISEPQPLVTVYVIMEVPPDIPDTTPDVPTVAILVFELLHTPPASPPEIERFVVAPNATVAVPVILPASGKEVMETTALPVIAAVQDVVVLVAKTV